MNSKIQITRRRKWKRYKIKGGAIVLLHKPRLIDIGKPKMIELGPVIDISMGGLAVSLLKVRVAGMKADHLHFHSVNRRDAALPAMQN